MSHAQATAKELRAPQDYRRAVMGARQKPSPVASDAGAATREKLP